MSFTKKLGSELLFTNAAIGLLFLLDLVYAT